MKKIIKQASLSDSFPPVSKTPGTPGKGTGTPGKGTGVVTAKISDEQKNTVRIMQSLMLKLSEEIKTKYDQAKFPKDSGWNKENKNQMFKITDSFGATGMKFAGATSADGIWGAATQKALQNLKTFITTGKFTGIIITESPTYDKGKDEEIIKNANDNINNIARLFTQLGFETPSEGKRKGISTEVMDIVPTELTSANAAKPFEAKGQVPVTVRNLSDILEFFNFVSTKNIRVTGVSCQPLQSEKPKTIQRSIITPSSNKPGITETTTYTKSSIESIAKIIKEAQIVKKTPSTAYKVPQPTQGQDPKSALTPYEPDVAVYEPKSDASDMCKNEFEAILRWFSQRSSYLYKELYEAYQNSIPFPGKDRLVNEDELKQAYRYQNMIDNLVKQWNSISKKVEQQLIKENKINKPLIKDIINNLTSSLEPGGARTRQSRQGQFGETVSDETETQTMVKGPLKDFMNFRRLLELGYENPESAKIDALLKKSVQYSEWAGGRTTWMNLARTYTGIDSDDLGDLYAAFEPLAKNIRTIIDGFYNAWAESGPTEAEERRQDTIRTKWTNAIQQLIARAARETRTDAKTPRGK